VIAISFAFLKKKKRMPPETGNNKLLFLVNFTSIVSPLLQVQKNTFFVSNKKKNLKVVHIIEALGGGVYTY
jgi:hypothetical protein